MNMNMEHVRPGRPRGPGWRNLGMNGKCGRCRRVRPWLRADVNECTVWNRRVLSSRAADRMRWKLEFVDVLRHAPNDFGCTKSKKMSKSRAVR